MTGLNALLRSVPSAMPNALLQRDPFAGPFAGRVYTPEEVAAMADWAGRTIQPEGHGYAVDDTRLVPSAGFAEYLRRIGY